MALADITADLVRAAIAEHDESGAREFCAQHGFPLARDRVIVVGERRYGTRVICAAAHRRLPGQPALSPEDVGETAAGDLLQREGFTVQPLRPPPWRWEELVLACSLLFRNGRKALRASSGQVEELSALLRTLPFHEEEDRGAQFRSVNSVQRKLYDLMTRLPSYEKVRTRAGRLDEKVLKAFLDDEQAMHWEADAIRAGAVPESAWAVFSSESRKYGGNAGYGDVLGVQYVYDSKVPNHRRVQVGDVVVVRNNFEVHGVGRIHRIETTAGVEKEQLVCPNCGSGRFDARKRQRPRYRCRTDSCRHEFEQPTKTSIEVDRFTAFLGGTWRPLDGALTPEELKSALLDRADQNAIRPVDSQRLQAMLSRLFMKVPPLPPNGEQSVPRTPRGGRREVVTKVRTGQAEFRAGLLRRYGASCAITGPCPVEALQAAHLKVFAEHETHVLDEGMLLRADVHLLFDNKLLAVDPDSWRVVIAPVLDAYPHYSTLAGVELVEGPSPAAVREHYEAVTASWGWAPVAVEQVGATRSG